ncbi:unnamed protein product [Phytophthora fragariaefolia]|uniref:Unnamed protein product n=1 Tax=Phytophthora fragariaefolia TaxID=1490495 RepID=A0A9W7D299_9STRA|nr:unnamed protein product [Phytophthora fragariaefolia]
MTAITAEKVVKYKQGMLQVKEGMSIRKAAKKVGVPTENLRSRVAGDVPVECRAGPMLTYLSEGDEELLEVIEHRTSRGFCVGNVELRCLIRQAAIVSSTRPNPKGFPSRTFVDRWRKKHSENISFRKARILEGKRAEASTEAVVRYYCSNLEAAIDELQLRDCPAQIWNCDETGNVSIMGCINAFGEHMPPMYIFAGKRRKVEWMADAPPSAVCAMTESSNINGRLFLHWVKWFVGRLPVARPQLLILDGHFAHVDFDTVTWAKSRGVHRFALLAHTSHFLQSLDVGVYQHFKRLYEGELEQFPLTTGFLPTKNDIVSLTKLPFEKAFAEENARKSFQKAGIYPLSLARMLDGLIGNVPSTDKKTLRHHAVILPHVEILKVSKRQQHCLKRRGINMDALNVVNIAVRPSVVAGSARATEGAGACVRATTGGRARAPTSKAIRGDNVTNTPKAEASSRDVDSAAEDRVPQVLDVFTGEPKEGEVLTPLPTVAELLELEELSYVEFLDSLKSGELAEVVLLRPEGDSLELNSSSVMDAEVLEDERTSRRQTRYGAAILKDPSDPYHPLLKEFSDVVSDDPPSVLPPDRGVRHEIDLVPGTKYCTTRQ